MVSVETEILKFCTEKQSLLEDRSIYPYLLKEEKLSFMKKNLKFDFDSIWDREVKNLPSSIAFCPGIINLMKMAVVIPAWCDFLIKVTPEGEFEWRTPDSTFEIHSHGQRGEGQFNGFKKEYVNLKFINPWMFFGNPQEQAQPFFFMQPWLHEEERWEVAQGVQTPWYGMEPNINVLIKIPKNETSKIFIKKGEPLCYILPFQKLWSKVEVHDHQQYHNFNRLSFSNWKRFLVRGKKCEYAK